MKVASTVRRGIDGKAPFGRMVARQQSTLHAATLTEAGEINEHHTYVRTGVVDVGTYTVDLALDDNGEFKDAAEW
jgi:hypothetical protein